MATRRGNLKAPRGSKGATGPTGQKGTVGRRGPQGARGLTGNIGRRGPTGKAGKKGPEGLQGPLHKDSVLDMVMTHFEDVYRQIQIQTMRMAQMQAQIDLLT